MTPFLRGAQTGAHSRRAARPQRGRGSRLGLAKDSTDESTPTMGRLAQAALIFLNSNAHVAEAVVHSVVNGVPRAPSVAFLALPRDSGRGAASRRRRPWAPLRNARLGHRPHLLPGVPACSCSGLTALWERGQSAGAPFTKRLNPVNQPTIARKRLAGGRQPAGQKGRSQPLPRTRGEITCTSGTPRSRARAI